MTDREIAVADLAALHAQARLHGEMSDLLSGLVGQFEAQYGDITQGMDTPQYLRYAEWWTQLKEQALDAANTHEQFQRMLSGGAHAYQATETGNAHTFEP